MPSPDDNFSIGTVGQSPSGGIDGLILQQLKIITLILREGFSVNERDEDLTILAQPTPTITPASTLPNI